MYKPEGGDEDVEAEGEGNTLRATGMVVDIKEDIVVAVVRISKWSLRGLGLMIYTARPDVTYINGKPSPDASL